MTTNTNVLYHQDGAIDEFIALMLLDTMPNVNLVGTVMVNADCIEGPAMDVQWQLQSFMGNTQIPAALSSATGWNPFPWEYREDCIKQSGINALRGYGPNLAWPPYPDGEELTRKALKKAGKEGYKLTLLVNGPLKALQMVLEKEPKLAAHIERVICMGGAIGIGGNLDPQTLPFQVANPLAEWNMFWDPKSVDWIFKNTDFEFVLFPLNVTNKASLAPYFLDRLGAQRKLYDWSEVAFESYALVRTQSFYSMWDVTAATWLTHPEFFVTKPMSIKIVTDGFYQGTLEEDPKGRKMTVVTDFAPVPAGQPAAVRLYDYVLEQFRRNSTQPKGKGKGKGK
jgi:purine nucleosidase